MDEKIRINPMPDSIGVGFTSHQPIDIAHQYRTEQSGRYYNHHVTPQMWKWPTQEISTEQHVIDAFSPNVNKDLHVGHLRNLALAVSLKGMFPQSKFVAMLGYSMGEKPGALENLQQWFDFTDYHPKVYIDVDLQIPDEELEPGTGKYEGGVVWNGCDEPVLVIRSQNHYTKPGEKTYAYHDLAFNKQAAPTHIITGMEQKSHFAELGIQDKHVPMGLVLDPLTGQKMKSRSQSLLCEVLSGEEAVQMVIDNIRDTSHPKKLAWNVLAWNFLSVGRKKDVKFNVDEWTKTDSPGLYISYTAARISTALNKAGYLYEDIDMNDVALTNEDVNLLGRAEYFNYWYRMSKDKIDPSYLANFIHYIAKHLNRIYESKEQLIGGRLGFIFSVQYTYKIFVKCMKMLGMFVLESV